VKKAIWIAALLIIFSVLLPTALAAREDVYQITSIPYSISTSVRVTNYDDYYFTSPGDGSLTITLTPSSSSDDPDLRVYLVVNGNLQYVASSVRGAGSVDSVTITVQAGNTYLIRITGFSGSGGVANYRLSVTGQITVQPTPTPTPTTGQAPEQMPPPPPGIPEWIWNGFVYPMFVRPFQQAISAFWNGVIGTINTIAEGVQNVFGAMFDPIVNALQALGQGIVDVFRSIAEAISNAVRSVLFGGGGG